MKKILFFAIALLASLSVNAQVDFDFGKVFTIENGADGRPQPIEVVAPSTAKDGIILVGDTRSADKITDGKYRGMRINKSRRHFNIDGKVRQYTASLSFRRAPQGATKDHKVDVTYVPRSCMVQMKPLSDGKLTLCAQTNKEEGNNVYIAVRNGDTFKNIATLAFKKNEAVTGRKDAPFKPQSLDYTFTDGDEIWIYTDGSINLFGLLFTGKADKAFAGSNPVEVSKDVRRAQKNQ